MEQTHREIEFDAGSTIEEVVHHLSIHKALGELVYGTFSGIKLFSDTDDIESAYVKLTGKTKAENEAEQKAYLEEYLADEKKHKESIPELSKEWIVKGNLILDEEHHEQWAEIVPIRLDDLYRGMELGATLDIVKELNNNCELEKAKEIIDSQVHSSNSYSLVLEMVKAFCSRGKEFAEYIK